MSVKFISLKLKQNRLLRKLREEKPNSLLVITLITTVYSFIEFALFKPEWEELAFHTVVVGFLLYIVSLMWEIIGSIEFFGAGPERTARKTREEFIQKHSTATIVKVLQQWHAEIAGALRMSLDHQSFEVSHEMLSLRSYEIFWELLAAEQQKRDEAKQPPLNVLIIHSSSLEIWSEYAIRKKLFASQKQFTNHGGKATRILCAEGEWCPSETVSTNKKEDVDPAKVKKRKRLSPDVYNTIREVADSMKEAKIDVRYYNIENLDVVFDFSWDFLYVKETEAAVIWESFNPGGKIKTSTYQIGKEFKSYNLEKLWENIKASSIQL